MKNKLFNAIVITTATLLSSLCFAAPTDGKLNAVCAYKFAGTDKAEVTLSRITSKIDNPADFGQWNQYVSKYLANVAYVATLTGPTGKVLEIQDSVQVRASKDSKILSVDYNGTPLKDYIDTKTIKSDFGSGTKVTCYAM